MPARITVGDKTYKGRTIDSIARREFGPKAFYSEGGDGYGEDVVGIILSEKNNNQYVAALVTEAYEYHRPKYQSRQTRWDNATGLLRGAIQMAQEVYDEIESDEELEEGELDDEEIATRLKDREERLVSATEEAQNAMGELQGLRDECQEWEDNLPEAFQQGNSPVSEKLSEIIDCYSIDEDIEFDIDGDTNEAESVADEVECLEMPRGFGRD